MHKKYNIVPKIVPKSYQQVRFWYDGYDFLKKTRTKIVPKKKLCLVLVWRPDRVLKGRAFSGSQFIAGGQRRPRPRLGDERNDGNA